MDAESHESKQQLCKMGHYKQDECFVGLLWQAAVAATPAPHLRQQSTQGVRQPPKTWN
jgi:hypothetical protein